MRPFSARLPLLYRSMTAATSSSRVAMLTRLIAISPTPSGSGAFQMRQRINIWEHFWRGNARRHPDCRAAVIDLFGTQAILPALTNAYRVTPAAMGYAVNATTMGMAVAGLGVAYFSRSIDRRRGILVALTVLALPTALLAVAPNLAVFTALRVGQGLCMAAAFTLTLAYLGEHCSMTDAAGAFAAYITGNVASNLFGRLLAAGLADHLGLQSTFLALAALNLAGAGLGRVLN